MPLLIRFAIVAATAAPLAECPYDSSAANTAQQDGGVGIPPELIAILEYADQFGGTSTRPRPSFEQLCAISPAWDETPREEIQCSGCSYPKSGTAMGWVHALLGKPAEGASQYGDESADETFTFVDGSSLTLEYTAWVNPEACAGEIGNAQDWDFVQVPGEVARPSKPYAQNQLARFCSPPYWVHKIKVRAPLRYLQCWRARRANISTPLDLMPDVLQEQD